MTFKFRYGSSAKTWNWCELFVSFSFSDVQPSPVVGGSSNAALSPTGLRNTFSNDGSFLSKFLGMAQQQTKPNSNGGGGDGPTSPGDESPSARDQMTHTLPMTFQANQPPPSLHTQQHPAHPPANLFPGNLFNPHVPPPLTTTSSIPLDATLQSNILASVSATSTSSSTLPTAFNKPG